MSCEWVRTPSGPVFIVCGRNRRGKKKCVGCGKMIASLQCDWKVWRAGIQGTCDKHICATCALNVAPDKDLCPEHQTAYHAWAANRQARVGEL